MVLRDSASGTSRVILSVTDRQSGSRISKLNISGRIHQFSYGNGRDSKLLSWTRPGLTKPDTFDYDKVGALASIQPARGEAIVFKTEFTDPSARSAADLKTISKYRLINDGTYQYSYTGNPGKPPLMGGSITAEDKAGGKQSLAFAENGNIQISKNADGSESKTVFYRSPGQKSNGKLRRVEQNGKIVTENRYDKETGNLIESTDGEGFTTFFEYDPKTADKPLLSNKPIAIYRSSVKGKDKNKDQARELLARIKYNNVGRVIEQTNAAGVVTSYTYNSRGQLETVSDSTGKKSKVEYDTYGRVKAMAAGEQRQDLEYDEQGRIKTRKLPDGQTVENFYDELGNVTEIKQNGVTINTFDRDPNGRFSIQRDALARPTWMEYDTRGHVLAEHQPNGSTTWYGYDPLGHRTSQIDGDGHRIDFAYDPAGHLIRQANPLGQTLTWKYDSRGRLAGRTNGVQAISYDYDDSGRLASIDYGQPGEKLRYRYDERGRLQKIKTSTNEITLFYDNLGRIAAKQFTRGSGNTLTSDRVLRYSYGAQGQKTSVVLSARVEAPPAAAATAPTPSSAAPAYRLLQQTQYSYDTAGHLTEIKSNGTTVSTFRYNPEGRLAERSYGNSILGKYTYDSFGHQARLDLSGGPLIQPLLLAYEWDAAGQLKSRTWNDETQIYGYDLSGQLLSVVAASSSAGSPPDTSSAHSTSTKRVLVSNPAAKPAALLEQYRYDGAGNLLEKFENGLKTTLTYDAANQLQTSTTNTGVSTKFAYDKAGRLVSEAGTASKTLQYGFLDKVLVLTKADGTRLGYDYYPDGQLAAKGPLTNSQPQNSHSPKGLALLKELVALKADDDSDLTPSGTQR